MKDISITLSHSLVTGIEVQFISDKTVHKLIIKFSSDVSEGQLRKIKHCWRNTMEQKWVLFENSLPYSITLLHPLFHSIVITQVEEIINYLVSQGMINPADFPQFKPLISDIDRAASQNWHALLVTRAAKVKADSDLLQGLIGDDMVLVKKALDEGADVNQFFEDARIPLIVAIQQQDDDMVQLILQYNPDVNMLDGNGLCNPLGVAIINQNAFITGLLLKSGAHIFTPCMILASRDRFHDTFVTPFNFAVFNWIKCKSLATEQVLRTILRYGGGMGYSLGERYTPFLDKVVMFGGDYVSIEGVQPIVTCAQFQQYISSEDFPYWQKTLEKALVSPSVNLTRLARQEIQLTLDYITRRIQAASAPLAVLTLSAASPAALIVQCLSPITCASSAHGELIKRIQPICQQFPEFDTFMVAVRARKYGKALRIICSCTNFLSIKLVAILLKYKDRLRFDINERNEVNQTAVHYAALHGNKILYDLLTQYGANVKLQDVAGNTAAFYAAIYFNEQEVERMVTDLGQAEARCSAQVRKGVKFGQKTLNFSFNRAEVDLNFLPAAATTSTTSAASTSSATKT